MSKFIGSGKTHSSCVEVLNEVLFQNKIDSMYKSLGSVNRGVFVTVGFCRREPVKYIPPEREKCISRFFTFNEILNDFI